MLILKYLWSLPNTILGLLIALIYIPRTVRWNEGCIEIVPMWIAFNPGAQTFGWVIFYRNPYWQEDIPLRVHERVHVSQGFTLGPLFLFMYLGEWLINYIMDAPGSEMYPRWKRAYFKISYEQEAYRVQYECDRDMDEAAENDEIVILDYWGANP